MYNTLSRKGEQNHGKQTDYREAFRAAEGYAGGRYSLLYDHVGGLSRIGIRA